MRGSLHVLNTFNHYPRNGWNNLPFICMVSSECHEHKLCPARHLEVSSVVASGTGPTRFRPELHSFKTLQRDTGKTVTLVISVRTLPRVVAFQQFHHLRCSLRVGRLSYHYFHQQASGGVCSQLVSVLTVRTSRN